MSCTDSTIIAPRPPLPSDLELGSVFRVIDPARLEIASETAPEVTGVLGPQDPVIENSTRTWQFFSRGYSNQDRYSGPELHASENLGDDLAWDMLTTPGVYAIVGVCYDCDPQICEGSSELPCLDGSHLDSWVVLRAEKS